MDVDIVVCGAGTIGGTLVEHLARLGWGRMSVIDFDTVDVRNLSNQPYFKRDVGQPKVRSLTDLVYRMNGARLRGIHKRLTVANAASYLAAATVVVDAFDNHASRKLVTDYCHTAALPCLHVGLSRDGYAEVLWNTGYVVPHDVPQADACVIPASRTLTLMAVCAASEALSTFARQSLQRVFTVTASDLQVTEILLPADPHLPTLK